jgi:hypothetical protein
MRIKLTLPMWRTSSLISELHLGSLRLLWERDKSFGVPQSRELKLQPCVFLNESYTEVPLRRARAKLLA